MLKKLMMNRFKQGFAKKFGIKDVTRAVVFANQVKDEVSSMVWGNNNGKDVKGESDIAKLSENTQFTDMFLGNVEKKLEIEFGNGIKIQLAELTFNFKLGELSAVIGFETAAGKKEKITIKNLFDGE